MESQSAKCSCKSNTLMANEFEKIKYYLRLIISNTNELILSHKLNQEDSDDLQLLKRVFTTLDKIESQHYFNKLYVNNLDSTEPVKYNLVKSKTDLNIKTIDDLAQQVDFTGMLNYLEKDTADASSDSFAFLDNNLNNELAIKIRKSQDHVTLIQNQLTQDLFNRNPFKYQKLKAQLESIQQSIVDDYKLLGY